MIDEGGDHLHKAIGSPVMRKDCMVMYTQSATATLQSSVFMPVLFMQLSIFRCVSSSSMSLKRELSDDCGATGSATVIFSATDDCNNSTDFTATFTIQDATPPQAIANDFSTVLDGTGNASITVADIDGGSSDVCGEVTMTVAPSSFDCDDIGDHTVTLTVVDDCGLSSTATATVTVGAGDAPTITFNTPTGEPENIVVSNDPGECEADVTWDVPTSVKARLQWR